MPIRFALLTMLAVLSPALYSATPSGNMYMLGIALDQEGMAGGWVRVGPAGGWKTTLAGTVLKDHLYTVEANGSLWQTNLADGAWKQIGKNEFANTARMFAAGDSLYSLEKDGSLYHINTEDGTWTGVGPPGAWKAMRAAAVHNSLLYTAEKDGDLVSTQLPSGERKVIGKKDFAVTTHLFSAGDALVSIDKDGSLFRVNPADGRRKALGQPGEWKATLTGTILRGQLYTVETGGALYSTNLTTGKWRQIGSNAFGATDFMFATNDFLYTIEKDGNLYRVFARPDQGIDAYNWCPEEIEKVFREQGNSFYNKFTSRQVLGNEATHANAMDGFAWLRQNATARDSVVIYIGAHGSTDPKQGWGIATADGKMLWGHEIKPELATLPCPVLLLIETCTSGGFAEAHANDPAVPSNVTVLCACQANQTTDNQLDLAVAEALYGRADTNHDGVVDMEELVRYTRARYKEWWPDPRVPGSQTPVIVECKALVSAPLTKVSPHLSAVAVGTNLWSAVIEAQENDTYHVHLLGWSCKPHQPYFITDVATRNNLFLPEDGPPLLVNQNGQWLPARLIAQNNGKITVRYLGNNQEETVNRERIKYPFQGRAREEK